MMIDGSEKRNRQLAFELQNSHVCEKRSKKYSCYTTTTVNTRSNISMKLFFIGVRAGGARGAAAPPNFGQLRFFGHHEKIWAKPVFKDVPMFLSLF